MKSLDIPPDLTFATAIHDLRQLTADKNGIPDENLQLTELSFHFVDETTDTVYSPGFAGPEENGKSGEVSEPEGTVMACEEELRDFAACIHDINPNDLVFVGFTCLFAETITGTEMPSGAYTAEYVQNHGNADLCYMDCAGKVQTWKDTVEGIACPA